MFSVELVLAGGDPHLVAAQAVARAERIALEVVAVGHRRAWRRRDRLTSRPAARDRHIVPKKRPANSFRANTSFCSGVPCAISRLALPLVSMPPPPMPTRGLGEEAVGRHLDDAGQLHAADLVVLRRGEHAGLDVGARARRGGLRAGCTFSPSKRGSSVSTMRLNGANFSRAMRSQVSSTAVEGLARMVGEARRAGSDSTSSQS